MSHMDREGHIHIANILRNAGLEQKEIDVYIALLTLGPSVVSSISKSTKLNRATLYFILDRLEQKNFAQVVVQGKIRHYAAKKPQEILSHLHEKQESLRVLENQISEALPLFQALSLKQEGSPLITSYKGLEGIKPLYREILQHEYFSTFNLETMYQSFGKPIAEALFGKNFVLHGKDLLVDNAFTRDTVKNWIQTKKYEFNILPPSMTFTCDIIGWNDSIALFTYDLDHTTIVIKNQQIHDMLKQWFDVLWEVSKEHSSRDSA